MSVLATSVPVTDGDEKIVIRVFCIYYPVRFQEDPGQKGQGQVRALFDSGSEVNIMSPAYIKRLDLKTWKTNVGSQKIDGSALETFEMIIANFQVEDKSGRPRFFQKTFLMANTQFEVVLVMPFLKISNTDVSFGESTLTWKFYTTNKALLTTEQVQLVNPKKLVIAALDADSKTFVMYVAIQKWEEMAMDPDKKAQIKAQIEDQIKTQSGVQVGVLLFNEAPTEIPAEYSNYSNVFLAENAAELPKNTGMNEHAIKLEKDKQLLFGPIYSLSPIELKTLKTYIKTNLANGFIRPSKSPAGAPIFFDQKPDENFCFCVHYWGLNNITIKNQYPLPLISESLDRLGRTKRFT